MVDEFDLQCSDQNAKTARGEQNDGNWTGPKIAVGKGNNQMAKQYRILWNAGCCDGAFQESKFWMKLSLHLR